MIWNGGNGRRLLPFLLIFSVVFPHHFYASEMSATIHDLRDKVDFGTEKGVIVSLELEELRVSTQEIIQRLKDENRGEWVGAYENLW